MRLCREVDAQSEGGDEEKVAYCLDCGVQPDEARKAEQTDDDTTSGEEDDKGQGSADTMSHHNGRCLSVIAAEWNVVLTKRATTVRAARVAGARIA